MSPDFVRYVLSRLFILSYHRDRRKITSFRFTDFVLMAKDADHFKNLMMSQTTQLHQCENDNMHLKIEVDALQSRYSSQSKGSSAKDSERLAVERDLSGSNTEPSPNESSFNSPPAMMTCSPTCVQRLERR